MFFIRFSPHILLSLLVLWQFYISFGAFFTAVRGVGDYGSVDFIQYWSAFRVFLAGRNPYSGVEMLSLQQTLRETTGATMMWNPPWLLVLMSPVLALPYKAAWISWYVLTIIFVFLSTWLLLKIYRPEKLVSSQLLWLLVLAFPPLWNTLNFGQLGGLLLLGVSLFFFGLERQRSSFSAFGLLLMSVKPHLFYLLFCYCLLLWFRKSHLSLLRASLILGLAVVLPILVWNPEAMVFWFQSFYLRDNPGAVAHVSSWIGAHPISGFVRLFTEDRGFLFLAKKAKFLLPCFTLGWLYLYLRHSRNTKDSSKVYSILLVSFLTAPFGWFYDQTALAALFPAFAKNNSKFANLGRIALGVLFGVAFIYSRYFAQQQSDLFWFLPSFAFCYFFYLRTRAKI